MAQPLEDKSVLGYTMLGNTPAMAPGPKIVENYNNNDYKTLYNGMIGYDANTSKSDPSMERKYDMSSKIVNFPPSHPEYNPDTDEKRMNDSQLSLNHQYTTMQMMVLTTAALALIAVMISGNSSA
jgi:hypothetical protein